MYAIMQFFQIIFGPVVLAIPTETPLMLAMVVLWVIWSLILAFIFANIFGKTLKKPQF